MSVGSTFPKRFLAASVLLLSVAGVLLITAQAAPLTPAKVQTARSLGKAYYEQGQYTEAVAEFEQVTASGHAAALDHLDLGQALIQANQLDEALEELNTAKEMAPRSVAVEYNLGILYKRELRYPLAEAALRRVLASNPNDVATWFNLGDVYFAEHKLEPSLSAFERIVSMGYANGRNFYVAATFHCFTILSRMKQPAEAQKYLKLNMATRNKVPNVSMQVPALEAGKYGKVRIATAPITPAAAQMPKGIVFQTPKSPVLPAYYAPSPRFSSPESVGPVAPRSLSWSVAVGDYNGDGLPDIYLANRGTADSVNHLLRNNGNGTFTDVTAQAGVWGPKISAAMEFVDYNNSGHPSIVIAGLGGLTLYRNNGNGTFTDVTKQAGLKGNPCELDSDVKAVDIDNDGLLDLVVTAYGNACTSRFSPRPHHFSYIFPAMVSHLYRNNGDGTFTDITAKAGLESVRGNFRQVIFGDFNNDGYMDLLFLRSDGPPMLFINQGGDKFVDRTAEAGPAMADSHAVQGAVSDFNHDGKFDLALFGPKGYSVLLNQGDAHFEALPGLPAIKPPGPWFTTLGIVADLDGNGFDDLLVRDKNGRWHALLNHLGHFEEAPLKLLPFPPQPAGTAGGIGGIPDVYMRAAWLIHPGNLDLLGFVPGSSVAFVYQRQGPPPHWINIKLQGYKSNKQGIGDVIELKAGNFYDKVLAQQASSVRVFTGDLPKLDVVRVTWPNQVVQNSINVSTDSTITVRESERLASSCPFLYVWNGKRFVFFTDVLGAAPIGELAPDGTRLRPNPQDLVRLGSHLKPFDGNYLFQLTDEMREVDYFDRLRLLAVDHPASEDVYSNEIYAPTPVPQQLYFVRHKLFPISALNGRGENVLPLIRYSDGHYLIDFRRNRIPGFAQMHSLTLNFGRFPPPSHVSLWLRGWVFWTDSNASRALETNHHLKMTDPYLQVRNKDGKWVTVIPDVGLPSGTNRTMRVNLTGKFLTSDHHVRIITNLCIYWDQIFFTTDETRATPSFTLPLVSADLHYRGFSETISDPQHRQPDYFDYAHLMTHAPWNPARGPYTRYGPVRALLTKTDDQVVAMSPGDEITAKFSALDLPPLRPGWRRDFFISIDGYAKDGEPNTAFATSVEPLPFRGMANYPPSQQDSAPANPAYRRYLREYQTRPALSLIPSLAPVGK
ncbi:MAG: FG-GAP-like repeat-containing protein [Terriglobia bacterium]